MMKKLLIILTTIFLSFACSSSENDKNGNGTVNKPAEKKTSLAENTMPDSNGSLKSAINENLNGSVKSGNNSATNSKDLKTSTLAAVPAPDNSTFTSAMDKDGNFMEIRVFKEHPMLVKVERKIIGKQSVYKVFLKNGKILEAPADKMNNFRNLAPENILDAVGLLNQTNTNSKTKPTEKKEN